MTYFLCVFRVFARLLASSCQSRLALTKQLIFNSGTGEKCVFILITPGWTTLDCVCNVSDSPRSQMSHHVRNRFCEAILSVVYHHKRESLWIWESNSCLDCSENIWLIQIQNIQNQNWKSCCRLDRHVSIFCLRKIFFSLLKPPSCWTLNLDQPPSFVYNFLRLISAEMEHLYETQRLN